MFTQTALWQICGRPENATLGVASTAIRLALSVACVYRRVVAGSEPLPATPFIIAAGALAHLGQMNFVVAVLLATAASVLADLSCIRLGACAVSRCYTGFVAFRSSPTIVRRTENSFTRYGVKTLVFAKFIPGVRTVAPPLAGINRSPLAQFLIYDAAGALLWIGSFMLLGFLFSDQLEQVINYTERFGSLAVIVLIALVFAWIGWKYSLR